ncbi:MAG: phage portal protein, partial [Kurthia sp.]
YFIRMFCELSGRGQFDDRDITFTFNKMLLTNEAEIIQMARDSVGIISETTILENHPWVSDIGQEQERLAQQKEAELSAYDSRYGDLKEEEDE